MRDRRVLPCPVRDLFQAPPAARKMPVGLTRIFAPLLWPSNFR